MNVAEKVWTAADENELPRIAAELLEWAGERRKMAFFGQMGAGKTTLIRHLCENLGCTETASSPTFALVQTYPCPGGKVSHLDLYRLRDAHEAFEAGIAEIIWEEGHSFVEWPETVLEWLPADFVAVRIETMENGSARTITAG